MYEARCPGQDTRFWNSEDIFEVACPACSEPVEFFKTDSLRRCDHCGYRFTNPRLNFGCAEWCPAARDCLAVRMYAPDRLKDGDDEG
jgi:hypothetical protein